MGVALPVGRLYSFTGLSPRLVLPSCLNMQDRRYGCVCEQPSGVPFGCAVRLLGTVAADLHVRVRLTPRAWCWQYVRNSNVLCGWLFPLGSPLASTVVCSLLAYLITPSYWSLAMKCSLLATCVYGVWVHMVQLSCCVLLQSYTHNGDETS